MAGLVEGLLEGLVALRAHGPTTDVWLQFLWVAAFINLLLFGAGGLILAGAALVLTRLPIMLFAFFGFAFLAFTGWLALGLPWEIHQYAIYLLAAGLAIALTRWFLSHQAVTLRLFRRSLPLVAALSILAFIGVQGGFWLREKAAVANLPPASADSPNIIVVVVDTLRADHLSSYGYKRSTSPNIDRIASEGVLFDASFSTAPYTAPSHASLFTGLYPNDHGVQWITHQPKLEGRFPTLAEALQGRGYRTGAFSANTFWVTREQGFGRGFLHYEDYFGSIGDMILRSHHGRKFEDIVMRRLGFKDSPGRKLAADVNDSALAWLKRDQGRPFFVFLNYLDVHDPYFPPQPYRSKFSDVENPGGIINSHTGNINPELTPQELQHEIDAYDGAIAYVDEQIARLLSEVERLDTSRDTLLVITSDHGEAFGEHGVFIHANSVYLEEIHVPLIFWYPGHVPEGLRVSQPVSNASLAATVMDMLGEGSQTKFPIPSLAKLWDAPQAYPDWPPPLAEMEHWPNMPEEAPSHHGEMQAMVTAENHYIQHETLGEELYNWHEDPLESNDVADTIEGRPAIQQIKQVLSGILARR